MSNLFVVRFIIEMYSRSNRGIVNKYAIVASDIRDRIVDGTYEPGAKLPTMPQLCEMYGISKITVKHAMDELERLGLIARRRGSGTYVKNAYSIPHGVDSASTLSSALGGFTADHESMGEHVSVVVHEFSICHPEQYVADALGVSTDEYCYRISRTLKANEVPLQDQLAYIPLSVVPKLLLRDAEGSLYNHLINKLGLKIDSAHRRVSAVHPDKNAAEHLGISPETPVLKIVRLDYLDDGRACVLSIATHAPCFEYLSIDTR